MTATREQIVHYFLSLDYGEWTRANWCLHEDRNYWDVDEDTYINGVPLIVDLDYLMGYLLEVVEKDSNVVSYVVIVTGFGGHDSSWWGDNQERLVGTFFDRDVEVWEAMKWAVGKVEGLLEAMRELER